MQWWLNWLKLLRNSIDKMEYGFYKKTIWKIL